METSDFYGTEKVSRILLKIAPPVMLAQLIQALYNIVDSFFVGKYSETGLTALSIIYPVQLLMIALGVGTGVGINTDMAYYLGIGKKKKAEEVAGTGTPLGLILWIIFAAVCYVTLPAYAGMSTDSPEVIRDVVAYGRIVCLFSIGLFTEGIWSKILQAEGDMRTPMIAQIAGAVVNIILDPPSMTYFVPRSLSFVLVITSVLVTAAMLDNASPLNPNDAICDRSSTVSILLVECRRNALFTSSFGIPHPLSRILIKEIPPSLISTVTDVEPASMAFSTSSFTIEAGLSITSPAAILSIVIWSNT